MKKELTLKEAGSLGGKARAQNMSKEELRQSARKAAKERWKKGWAEFQGAYIQSSKKLANFLCESEIERKLVYSLLDGLNWKDRCTAVIPPPEIFDEKTNKIKKQIFSLYCAMNFWIMPNFPYEKGKIRPDITIIDNRNKKKKVILIECDSFQFHSSPEQLQKEKERERKMMAWGVPLLRFSGKEITDNSTKVAIEIIKFILK